MADTDTVAQRRERGRQVVREMLGDKFLEQMEASRERVTFGRGEYHVFSNVFAEYWDRGVIDRRTRSLVTIAFLTALRTPEELGNHVRAALNNGATIEEINEVLIHAEPYCGQPAASIARKAAEAALEKHRAEQGK